MRGSKFMRLTIHWDHYVPYAYQAANKGFVAACNVCNRLKWSEVFEDLGEARRVLLSRWRQKGYEVCTLEEDI